jgi:hypothetical protein
MVLKRVSVNNSATFSKRDNELASNGHEGTVIV